MPCHWLYLSLCIPPFPPLPNCTNAVILPYSSTQPPQPKSQSSSPTAQPPTSTEREEHTSHPTQNQIDKAGVREPFLGKVFATRSSHANSILVETTWKWTLKSMKRTSSALWWQKKRVWAQKGAAGTGAASAKAHLCSCCSRGTAVTPWKGGWGTEAAAGWILHCHLTSRSPLRNKCWDFEERRRCLD